MIFFLSVLIFLGHPEVSEQITCKASGVSPDPTNCLICGKQTQVTNGQSLITQNCLTSNSSNGCFVGQMSSFDNAITINSVCCFTNLCNLFAIFSFSPLLIVLSMINQLFLRGFT